jgi:hypothetical protein
MNRTALFLGLLGVLVAPRAWAVPAQLGSWTKNCQTGSTVGSLIAGQYACYSPPAAADNDDSSPVLTTTACDNIDIQMFSDPTGAAVAICTATYQPQMCPPNAQALTTDALKNAACATMTGVTTLSGNDAKSDLASMYMRVVGGAVGINMSSCRIVVKCSLQGEVTP